MTRGRWLVAGAFALAVIAAAGNLAYQNQRYRKARDFWGLPMAAAIGRAQRVELLELSPLAAVSSEEGASGETVDLGPAGRFGARRRDLDEVAGLAHLRRSLLDSQSFDWSRTPPAEPTWRYALRFDGNTDHTAALSADGDWVRSPNGQIASLAPRAEAIQEFLKQATAEPQK